MSPLVLVLPVFVFAAVGFEDFKTELSFRDDNEEKYGGDIKLWEKARSAAPDRDKANMIFAPTLIP